MSSPFPGPSNGYSHRVSTSSPNLAPRPLPTSQSSEETSIRPMRLKILYTFDKENKTNCLARWPHNLDVRTAYLDENTQIGVIELKTCIQAIVAASPELVAKLGQDYTVYAYDYSEYDTPLVGQGMLSWVLASSSPTPSAPAHQSRTMVTGRVCKNIMALFSSNSQETLEVKLRLVPVPTCLQSEYIESMKSYRELSKMMPEGFDAQAWTNFIQTNPGIMQLAAQSRSQSPAAGMGQKGGVGIEHVQRLLNQGFTTTHRSEQNATSQSDSYSSAEAIEQLPRPASQASNAHSVALPKRRGRPPKSASGLSSREERNRRAQASRQASVDMAYGSSDDRQEEGPAKKRAKVIRADYPDTTGFGKQPESLRVAASTAASLRIHQPSAIRPSIQEATSLEGPPREPTPIAGPPTAMQRPLLAAKKSGLRLEPFASEDTAYESPYPPSDLGKRLESEMNSPEGSRAESCNTSADIASSPPVFPAPSTAPSSPRLPMISQPFDSGFMSGSIDDLFEDDESRPLDDEDLDIASQYIKRPDLAVPHPITATPVPDSGISSHSDQMLQSGPSHEQKDTSKPSKERSLVRATATHPMNRTASSGDLVPSSALRPDHMRPSVLHRSQTWAGHNEDHPSSGSIMGSNMPDTAPRMRSRNRTGSGAGAKRKESIKSKLATSVANGEMPPFCENCGAIETPTWRKAWIKVHSGSPQHVVVSEEEGGIIAWQSLQTNAQGEVCLFRIIKRSLLPEDEGFTESLLCNPCGLWLHTRKCMRPKEIWDKSQGPDDGAGGPRKRASRSKKQKPDSVSNHPAAGASGSSALYSDGSSPAGEKESNCESYNNLSAPVYSRPRASSFQAAASRPSSSRLNESSAAAALQRAIQSSPVGLPVVQNIEPAGKDLTPKPTRRILFPSPSPSEPLGPSDHVHEGEKERSNKVLDRGSHGDDIETGLDHADKENRPPDNDGIDGGFTHKCQTPPIRSTTPTPSRRSSGISFKTPNRNSTHEHVPPTTGAFFSSAARALLRPQATPKQTPTRSNAQPLTETSPFTAQLNQLLSDANVSPPSRFNIPSLPSLNNTPARVRHDFDFSQFDPQDILNTDVPMPSSPPVWFGVYEDPINEATDIWGNYQISGNSPAASEAVSSKAAPTPAAISVDENGHATVDFLATVGGSGR